MSKSIAQRIRDTRHFRRLTQLEAATLADINAAQWALYEQGRRTPGAVTLVRICNALKVSSDYLLDIPPFKP